MRMKWGVLVALLAGLVAAVWIVWAVGFEAVWDAVAQAGPDGFLLLTLYAALVQATTTLGWPCLLAPDGRPAFHHFLVGRMVRDAISDISPFSPAGGLVASARLMIVKGMNGAYAAASVAADATTEAMAQVAFLAVGVLIAVLYLGGSLDESLLQAMVAVLLLAVPGIAALIFLQKRGADFVERVALRFFPQAKGGSFRQAVHELYGAPRRLTLSSFWHLVAWIGTGVGTWMAFRLVGADISLLEAIAIEALLATLRSMAAFVPAGIGVQEGGYAALAQLFGLPAEMGLAVSLLKRAREIVLGVPALLYWQSIEGRAALRKARP
jgi:putative membrane protein